MQVSRWVLNLAVLGEPIPDEYQKMTVFANKPDDDIMSNVVHA